MYPTLLILHSAVRYFVLLFLLIVIIRSLMAWQKNDTYTANDDKLSLWLFILTHTQLLVGIILYFTSPVVMFNGFAMKEPTMRYWLVEHSSMMLIAVVLITMARITAKKLTEPASKHKRLFLFNTIALIIILAAISMSGRGFLSVTV